MSGVSWEFVSTYSMDVLLRVVYLVERAPGVAVSDDTVETDLVEVRSLQLQHLVDAGAVDLVRSLADLLGGIVAATELHLDELLAVLVEKVERPQVGAARDLDQLCETISHLRLG